MNESAGTFFEACIPIEPGDDRIRTVQMIPNRRGVVLFADSDDRPILLLSAASLRTTVRNRLLHENAGGPTKRAKLTEIVDRIYYACCHCEFKNTLTHYQLARALYPDSYREHFRFLKPYCIKIDLSAKWPNFSVIDKPVTQNSEKVFGIFPTHKSAAEFKGILEEAFVLCRRPNLIDSPDRCLSCPYLQMRSCPAPCIGRISREQYLLQIADAVHAAAGRFDHNIERLTERMFELSQQTEFEEAAKIKERLKQLKLLSEPKFKWVTYLSELAILHIDTGPRIKIKGKRKLTQLYSAFLIRTDRVFDLGNFNADQSDQMLKALEKKISLPHKSTDASVMSEQISLLGSLIYRGKPPGIWLSCKKTLSAELIQKAISKKFELKKK